MSISASAVLVELLKRAQLLASTISNEEEVTQEIVDLAIEIDAELNELIGWFDPNWTTYEDDYVYDGDLIKVAKQFKRGELK